MNRARELAALLAAISFGWFTAAHADWAVVGAAMECDQTAGRLTIAGTLEVSEGNTGAVPPEQGFTALADGKHEIRCTLGDISVSGVISVYPPASRGECMGIGWVSIDQLRVGAVSLFAGPLNVSCGPEKPLVGVSLKVQDFGLRVEKCYAHSDWSKGHVDLICQDEDPKRFRASFDCTKGATRTEKLICASDTLSRLDHRLFGIYQDAMRFAVNTVPLRRTQRQWLQRERDSCAHEACLIAIYERRIDQVRHLIPKPASSEPVY
jgi:hypothetical protein